MILKEMSENGLWRPCGIDCRAQRGGYYGSGSFPSERNTRVSSMSVVYDGSRLTLYIS